MDKNQLALKSSNNVKDTTVVSPNYNKLSDNIRRYTPQSFQCTMFCGGTNCKYENPNNWTSTDNAIQGIFSNWITDDILAMARPSTSILVKKNVIQQFHSWGIKSIINLQMPKEHASCGPPLEESGYTYDPTIFMENDIFYYNFTWKDYGEATLQNLLDMVKVLAFAVKEGRVAIHCHAGLGRTGVLIACYLVYILRVRANDAINYIRLKRPGSVQTRGQILCIQEFATYILPLSLVYNVKEVTNSQQKDKKLNEFSLSKFLKNQRVILHGYEERTLKKLPKIVYRVCERILILSNCWCNEFAVGNVPFTNNFLVTKLYFKNRKDSTNAQQNETGSQQTLSTCGKGINLMSPTEDNSSTELSSHSLRENSKTLPEADKMDSGKLITNTKTSDGVEQLNNINGEKVGENLRENRCFQLLSQLQCGSADEIRKPYTIEEVAEAMLTNYNTIDDSTKKQIKQFEIDFNNCSQTTWSRLKIENNIVVLSGLLYDWLEGLKNPVLNREDLSNIVIYNKRPETCLQKLNIDSQYVLEFIIRFLVHLQPCENTITLDLLKRFAASLTQKIVLIKNVRQPVGKDFQKLRDGTQECLLNFMYSLYNIFEVDRSSSELPSPNKDDDSDVACPRTK